MRKYAWIYITVTIIAAIWAVRYFTNKPVQTEIAGLVDYENSVSVPGVIVRYETVYKTQSGGSLQPQVFDETRVSKGKKIAAVYTDGIDSALKADLDNVNEKIAKLENATPQNQVFGSDLATIETRVRSSVSELVDASISSDLSNLSVISQELSELIGTQQEISGEKSPRQNALNELYTKKREIEGRIDSAKSDVYSAAGGVYISGVDGCEAILTPEAVMSMGVDEFNSLNIPKRAVPKEHYSAGEYVCKTVDNGVWYAAASVPTSELYGVEKGDSVKVRIPELGDNAVKAAVESVSEESGGNVLVVVSSRNYIKNIYSERCVKLDIIKDSYYGLKVPLSAVRVDGENTGVFVNTDGVARFRKINVLYKNDEVAIAEKTDKEGFLKLYDPVIVNGRDIEQGKIVN